MPIHGSSPPLTDRLCSLAESQLQMQTSRSGALDARVLGVMAVDAALAAIVVDAGGAHHLWIAALALLCLSLGLAVAALRLAGAEATGPSVARLREDRETLDEHQLRESLLAELAKEVRANDHALARKDPLFNGSLMLLVRDPDRSRRETMMSHMEQPTTSRPMPDYPRTPDGKYKYTTWDGEPKYYPSTKVRGPLKGPLVPVPTWLSNRLSRLFKRSPKEL